MRERERERKRERELICKRLRGVRRGEREKVIGYWAFLHPKKKNNEKNWILKRISVRAQKLALHASICNK